MSPLGSLASVLVGMREARRARRIDAMQALFAGTGREHDREIEARRARWARWLTDISAMRAARGPVPRAASGGIMALLGVARSPDAHAALLAWAMDQDGEHGLGTSFAIGLFKAMGADPVALGLGYRTRRAGAMVYLEAKGLAVGVTLSLRGEECGWGAPRGGLLYTVSPAELSAAVHGAAALAQGAARGAFEEWSRAIDETLCGRSVMTEWKGFSPEVRFLLGHWQEYLDVVAVRAELDQEFARVRQRVVDRVREKYSEADGWDVTLDEDWVLLRRRQWAVSGEEWLAFVVVLTDIESVMTDGREGFWSALSLPTDGDFDAETFTTLVRARLELALWRPWLGKPWGAYALARHLPRLDGALVLDGELERHCLDEFARYVELVPTVEQALRDMG